MRVIGPGNGSPSATNIVVVLVVVVRFFKVLRVFITAQCTLVHMRGLGIACRPSVRPSVRLPVCNVGGL